MAVQEPACPECTTPVRADWDWCLRCGFDPDGLKPKGWFPGAESAPAPPEPPSRRRRRAAGAKEGRAKKARGDDTAPLRSVPPAPAQMAPVAPVAPVPRPAPTAPTRAATPSVVLPPLDLAAPSRQLTSERVFPAPRVAMVTGLGVALLVLAAFMAFLAVSSIIHLFGGGTGLSMVTNSVFVLVCLALAGAMGAQGRALLTMKVVVTPLELVAYGRSVRVQRVRLDEIYSLRLGQRPMSALLGEPQAVEVPYVQGQDGSGFWLDALGGLSAERPPTPAQLEMFDQLTALVDRSRSVPTRH